MRIGACVSRRRMRQTSKPSRPGSMRSRSTSSGRWERARLRADSPSSAVTTWKPSRSRLYLRVATSVGSSSTTRIFFTCVWAHYNRWLRLIRLPTLGRLAEHFGRGGHAAGFSPRPVALRAILYRGGVPEWFNGTVLKTVVRLVRAVGSNPTPSAGLPPTPRRPEQWSNGAREQQSRRALVAPMLACSIAPRFLVYLGELATGLLWPALWEEAP